MLSMVVFEGGRPNGKVDTWLSGIRGRMAAELALKGLGCGAFAEVLLVGDRDIETDPRIRKVDSSHYRPFHFGRALTRVLKEQEIDGFCYFSGGSASLYSEADLMRFARTVEREEGAIVANNAYSADFFGCSTSSAFLSEDLPDQDNCMPIYLADRGRAKLAPLPYSPEASFDVDTPTDAIILAMSGRCAGTIEDAVMEGPPGMPEGRFRRCVQRIRGIKELMHKEFTDITLMGRVGPAAVMELNRLTRCRYRLFSEERGMRSFGRDAEGTARTFMAGMMRMMGVKGALEFMMSQTEGFLFDDRVLFAAMGAKPRAEERYLCDLMAWELLPEGLLKDLAKAALEVDGVCLGGHSLVNSGAVVLAGQA